MVKHSILVVDTDESIIDRVKGALSSDGYKVQVAGSSQQAVEAAPRVAPNLVIINPIMPGRSGVETAKQISKAVGSKVLFLSELAKDADFREVLRGLKQQGCDCTAMGRQFEPRELVTHVRREIGPVIVLTDRDDAEPTAVEARRSAVAAPARVPLPDYVPLLEFVGPRMYERNAFRLTGLRVNASFRDISKQAERLEMMAKLGVAQNAAGSSGERYATVEEIRSALQSLKTPEQRLLHEYFWFWPSGEQVEDDAAVQAVCSGEFDDMEKQWLSSAVAQNELTAVSARLDGSRADADRTSLLKRKRELERAAAVSMHNLAVLNHLRAIAAQDEKSAPTTRNDAERYWKTSFQYWQKLRNQHLFWEVLVERIRAINDPRLNIDIAERIWTTLPLALFSINASLAIAAAEKRKFEAAGQQRQLMKESGLGDNYVREALCRSMRPLREELARLCETAERESHAQPERGAEIVRKLFEDKKRYLQTFNYLLGAGDPFRDAANDLVAESARSALVAYANKTESWETAQMLFEECLALAESKSLRSRLEDDLEMLAGNTAGQRAARRTQATAAPPSSRPAQGQTAAGRSMGSTKPRQPKRRGLVIGSLAAIAIVIVLIVIGNSDDNSSSREPTTTQSTPARAIDSTPIQPQSDAGGPWEGYSPNKTRNSVQPNVTADTEVETLRSTIEENQAQLKQMKSNLSSLDAQITSLKSEIDTDKDSLTQMEHDHDLGSEVDTDMYEATRQRHNAAVRTFNSLVNQYNASLPEYKALLNTTNADIDQYNALVRSR
jgi:DNA-binding response OmpR family regulator